MVLTLRSFSNDDGDGKKKGQRLILLLRKKKNNNNNNFPRASHFFVHFFAVTARLRRENA